MAEISALKDASFLRKLDLENIKTFYVKILVLDKNELPLRAIEGRVSTGSISIDGSSSIRRSGSITFLAEEKDNDLTDVDNLLSMNKKIKILIGIENNIDEHYDKIIWFKQGIFVITNPSISHNMQGVTINLQFKDKMCLMNGECGGNLPTSITFNEYDQIIGYREIEYDSTIQERYPGEPNNYTVYGFRYTVNNQMTYMMWDASGGWYNSSYDQVGERTTVPQKIFDIIQTLVCNYGGEAISNIIINDVPLELRSSVRYTGSGTLFYNSATDMYTQDSEVAAANDGTWIAYGFNEDCGYIYTDFTYPGKLVSSIGDNVCSILDKIKQTLGNFEYYYDIDGKFIFREVKNYLNTQYSPVQTLDREYTLTKNGYILNEENYFVDFSNKSQSVYTFDKGSALISAYSNAPKYSNIKNDFHIWGKNADGYAIHYHLAIKEKPVAPYSTWTVVDELDEQGEPTGKIHLAKPGEKNSYSYTPKDWRAELYCQGLQKKALQQRPDIYEQELLDLFDAIYDMRKKEFKSDLVNHPNDLQYWFDYIDPIGGLHDISVDAIGPKIHSYQQDKIRKLYDAEIPPVVMIDAGSTPISRASLIAKCEGQGQAYSNVTSQIYKSVSLGTVGYSAQETARDLLYKYTDYTAAISITSIPIYYLDANVRITVQDRAAGIYGDYVIKTINLPLDAKNTMSISATRALERV